MANLPAISNKRQWEDWLSPILIKELRQGLREPSFVVSFIALQVGLAFLIFIGLGSENDSGAIETQSALFQGALVVMFLLILPLRGLVALSGEKRYNTLETMLLTRISPWGVVFGKWTALVFQGFLLATTVLPYIIIRYLAGGEELVDNMIVDAYIFWGFIVISAVCVALSAVSILSRICCFIGLSILYYYVITGSSASAISIGYPIGNIVWALFYMIFTPLLVFEFAATSVSSNHGEPGVIRKRLLLLLFLALLAVLQVVFPSSELFYFGTNLFVVGVIMEICQLPDLRARCLAPFLKYRFFGRLLSLLFLPGWPSGILFALFAIPLACGLGTIEQDKWSFDYRVWLCLIVAFFGSILIPLIGILLLFRKLSFRMFLVILINLIWFANCSIIEVAFNGSTVRPLVLLEFFPSLGTLVCSELTYGSGADVDEQLRFIIKGGVVDLFALGILVLCAVPWVERLNQTWATARDQLKASAAAAKGASLKEI